MTGREAAQTEIQSASVLVDDEDVDGSFPCCDHFFLPFGFILGIFTGIGFLGMGASYDMLFFIAISY